MRYFLNTATKLDQPVIAGGETFDFEPIALRGGTWLGVLALGDASRADILAAFAKTTSFIDEVDEAKYESEKKNLSRGTNSSIRSSTPPQALTSAGVVADRVGRVSAPPFANNGGPNSTEGITPVTILGRTKTKPPAESLLQPGSPGAKPWSS